MYSPSHYLNVWGKRMVGIEPTTSAWKADVLPLNYTRTIYRKDAESALGVPGTWFVSDMMIPKHMIESDISDPINASGWDRTSDRSLRRRLLYSAELLRHVVIISLLRAGVNPRSTKSHWSTKR